MFVDFTTKLTFHKIEVRSMDWDEAKKKISDSVNFLAAVVTIVGVIGIFFELLETEDELKKTHNDIEGLKTLLNNSYASQLSLENKVAKLDNNIDNLTNIIHRQTKIP